MARSPKRLFVRIVSFLWLWLLLSGEVAAHEGGPPTITLEVGQLGVYVIKSDVGSEGGPSFYLAHPGHDTNVVQIAPEGTFSSPGNGEFSIRAIAPGRTTVTFGWLYPPNDAGGLFTCEVIVNPPATRPPTAANAVSSATSNDPVNLFTGELTMMEPPDFNLGGPMPLLFARYYSSGLARQALPQGPLGDNWSINFDWRLRRSENQITVVSWDGRRIPFDKVGGGWKLTGLADIPFQLVESGSEYILGDPRENLLYTFDSDGQLTTIEDGRGNAHTLSYKDGRLANVSDGLGRALTFAYAGFQQLTAISDGVRTVRFGYTNVFVAGTVDGRFKIFDQYAALSSVSNPLGNTTRYVYGGSGTSNHIRALLTTKARPLGNAPYTQTWNDRGQVATQTDAALNTYTFTYNGSTTIMTNPLGQTRTVVHAASGQMASFTDEAGGTIAILSNTNGQRSSVTDRRGGTTRLAYHAPSGKVSEMTTADGLVTRFDFASRTNRGIVFYDVSRVTYPDGATEEFAYDAGGNVLSSKDRAGKLWRMTYNNRGQVLTVANPLGGQAVFAYHANGTVASRMDSDSGATRFLYDEFSRMTNAVRADGSTVQTVYDPGDRVTAVTDERGSAYRYAYDANDRLTKMTDPAGKITQYQYDARDRLVRVADRLGNDTLMAYDPLEQLSKVTNRNGHVTAMEYDARRRLSALVDPGGKRWTFSYDPEGIIAAWANPLGQTQAQESDMRGYPIAYIDALGRRRSMTRNHLGLVTRMVDELARTNSRAYDSRGLLSAVSKPVIGSARYERNDLGQVTRRTDPTGQHWLEEHTPMGRLQSETDPLNRSTTYQYDTRGRLVLTSFADGTTRQNSYDSRNNPSAARFSDGTQLQYAYDALNRLVQAGDVALAYDGESRITNTVASKAAFGAAYDPGGRLVLASYNNGLFAVSYEYDSRDRLTRVSDSLSGTELIFTYDDAGRMTGITRPNGVNGAFTYDPAGRLTRIQEGSVLDLSYTLDPAGQVVQADMNVPLDPAGLIGPANAAFRYDAARQITTPGYSYDARGRMTASPGHSYLYDGASRMVQADGVKFTYNDLNDTTTRTEGGSTLRYFYNYALGQGPIVAERNEATSEFVRYYVWSPGGRLLYLIDAGAGKARHFHFDRVGSTLALTDDTGAVTDAYAYSPYGKLLGRRGADPQPFTFIGRYGVRQEGSNLCQMRARYYSPATGSFLTPDPLRPRLEDIHSLNPYQYVAGDPLRAVDPEGLDRTIWFFGHAWIEVDVYDAQGRVTGRVALNFAPESGKSDYQVMLPRQIIYPHVAGYDMKSSQLDDELLVREWRRLQRDPTRGQQWNPIKNCIWRSVEYANAEMEPTLAEAVKYLNSTPLPTDMSITAAPPEPWYKEAYHWVGDNWGDFEDWLTKALD